MHSEPKTMRPRILVTGATGRLGRELVRRLIGGEEFVRVGTRWPERAQALFGEHVEVVELDYTSTETYDAAVQWVDRVFLSPPPFDPDAADTLTAFLDWVVDTGANRIVLLSAMGTEHVPELPLRRLEQHLEALDVDRVVLRPNLYMQNFSDGPFGDEIRERGTFELCAGSGRVSFVDVRDVAAVAATALKAEPLARPALTLTGPAALSFAEAAAALADAAGLRVEYRPVDADRMRESLRDRRWPDRQAEVAVRMFRSVADGRREPVTTDIESVLGRPAISFDAFANEAAEALR